VIPSRLHLEILSLQVQGKLRLHNKIPGKESKKEARKKGRKEGRKEGRKDLTVFPFWPLCSCKTIKTFQGK
jgi:hypothetical protein